MENSPENEFAAEQLFVQAPEADATLAGDRAAIFHRGTRVTLTLNATGTVLWLALAQPRRTAELVEALQAAWPALPGGVAKRDVVEFLKQVLEHGVVKKQA